MTEPTWLVTIQVDEHRTRDFSYPANSAYHARWLHLQLHPGTRIIVIRPVKS
jgi:hypothetical protein